MCLGMKTFFSFFFFFDESVSDWSWRGKKRLFCAPPVNISFGHEARFAHGEHQNKRTTDNKYKLRKAPKKCGVVCFVCFIALWTASVAALGGAAFTLPIPLKGVEINSQRTNDFVLLLQIVELCWWIHMCIWVEVGVWSCLAGGQEEIWADDWLWPKVAKGGQCRSSSEKKSEQFMSRDCWCLNLGFFLEMFRFHVEQNIFQNIFQIFFKNIVFWWLWQAAPSNSINPSISCPAVGVFKTLWNTSDSPAELRISITTTQRSSGAGCSAQWWYKEK